MRERNKENRQPKSAVREAAAAYSALSHSMPQEHTPSTRRAKNEAVIRLIDEWLADESGYDEETWPILKQAIEENRTSYRRRFSD